MRAGVNAAIGVARRPYSAAMPAALMIGHHLPISAL
jgi:hypothetical protein